MRPLRRLSLPLAALTLAFAGATAPTLAAASDEALALVPPDVASVGVIHLDALRSSPFAARLFAETDDLAVDGDAAKFLAETGLRPRQDVDMVVVAGLASNRIHGPEDGLVIFQGRFEPARLEAAMEARGAIRKPTPQGDYLLLGDTHGENNRAAIAVLNQRLVVAGSPESVTRALAARQSGGSGFLRGEGLGRQIHRVPAGASAWAIVDATRAPFAGGPRRSEDGDAADALVGAMKSVSLFVFHATTRGDSLELSATGVTADEETRDLLEDALKGVIAMWRLAIHEKSPDMVPILRKFEIESDREGVTIHGTLPGSFLRKMAEKRQARRDD
ncbi:MAG TPA: hypothetical protein VGS98_00510 [Thermoanaerobaculia bacterium]|jgi:hypothetical protein|nr:hypothetical protein [Thermoanaerobaculia bacterium]